MKRRSIFVSNSSSASFVIVGLVLTPEIREKLEAFSPDWYDEFDYTVEAGKDFVGAFLSKSGHEDETLSSGFVKLSRVADLASVDRVEKLLEVTSATVEDLVIGYGETLE
jgi:hypothetical protein